MARFLKKRAVATGLSPGTPVFIGEKKVAQPSLHEIKYDRTSIREREIPNASSLRKPGTRRGLLWINVYGLHDAEVMKHTADAFDIHPLALEDIMNTGQRPKCEEYDGHLQIMVKMIRYDQEEEVVHAEHLSIILGKNFLVTFQERKGDVFNPVRERIRKKKGRIRSSGPDYLAYALIDTVVDNYINVIERLGEKIEDLDESVIGSPSPEVLQNINVLRREVNYLRKTIRPAREAIFQLTRMESRLIQDATRPFLKDLLDLATQASEAIDMYRDMLSDHLNNYNAAVSYRMNDIMRVLTIYAAIFIPLTFIAGIYGMNFDNLPELHFESAYYVLWGVMLSIAGGMLVYFKRKGWL